MSSFKPESRERDGSAGPGADALVATEALVANIWREVLEVEDIRPEDDFLDLGGDSLHAFRIITAIADKLHVQLELGEFLEHQTVRELVRYLEARSQAAG
jgi:acyl carrier protein